MSLKHENEIKMDNFTLTIIGNIQCASGNMILITLGLLITTTTLPSVLAETTTTNLLSAISEESGEKH